MMRILKQQLGARSRHVQPGGILGFLWVFCWYHLEQWARVAFYARTCMHKTQQSLLG